MTPSLLPQLVRVAQRPDLQRLAKRRGAGLGLEESAAEPEFGRLLGPLDDDAGMPDPPEAVPQQQPRPPLRQTIGYVVHVQGNLESFSSQHDVQEVIVGERFVLLDALARIVLGEHLLRPLFLQHLLGRVSQPLAYSQEPLGGEARAVRRVRRHAGPCTDAFGILAHGRLEVHLHSAQDLLVGLQGLHQLLVHLFRGVVRWAIPLERPVVDPLHEVGLVVPTQIHVPHHGFARGLGQAHPARLRLWPTPKQRLFGHRLGRPGRDRRRRFVEGGAEPIEAECGPICEIRVHNADCAGPT
mmetsp:Transcript_7524/g.27632  ORF Transcript_7524/g.27632 Transcript_7524/m.27632 type:complete len:298 (-) Transcript_7524:457-1350(-)